MTSQEYVLDNLLDAIYEFNVGLIEKIFNQTPQLFAENTQVILYNTLSQRDEAFSKKVMNSS